MRENKAARNCLIIAVVILAVTASFFGIVNDSTKKKMGNIKAVPGKDESPDFSQVVQTALNSKEYGASEEDVRFTSLPSNKEIIEIKEKMFIAQTNDIYLNAEDYLGKIIKLEGLFKQDDGYDKSYFFVIRYGPGCCGFDSNAGFEVEWAKGKVKPYPAVDSWVEAAGELKTYEEDGMKYLYLDLASLNVLNKRGAETVMQ
jgi:uncharacterized membrane protein YcgQ (UPF0703/DUF1980 family)